MSIEVLSLLIALVSVVLLLRQVRKARRAKTAAVLCEQRRKATGTDGAASSSTHSPVHAKPSGLRFRALLTEGGTERLELAVR